MRGKPITKDNNNSLNKFASKTATISNFLFRNKFTSGLLKKTLNIAPERSLPLVSSQSFENWLLIFLKENKISNPIKEVFLFVDEFTNYSEVQLGIDTVELLTKLNYKVNYIKHEQSGRALISKGFLEEAKSIADKNISVFKNEISGQTPLIGIEPSAILTFKDEYLRLADDIDSAKKLAENIFLIDEFIANETEAGTITSTSFSAEAKTVKLHVHCHQKALSTIDFPFKLLSLPKNYSVSIINSGCCGMAGSFGYEKEHYETSMKMGELSLFPKIRKTDSTTLIAATGTSCRHQIKDGTNRTALHPISILREALI